jgi:hypothetical protein
MNAERAAAVRTQYPARPGRRVVVVTDLASLRGPLRGTMQLPLRLYWSGPSPMLVTGPCRTRTSGRRMLSCLEPLMR